MPQNVPAIIEMGIHFQQKKRERLYCLIYTPFRKFFLSFATVPFRNKFLG